jgi:putative thioredoxin
MPVMPAIDVREADFAETVLARSRAVPVLVDFWAPWCGPCRVLGPVLERLAGEADGRFVLAKLDTDENPELAARYEIRGIPAVKLFRDGEVVAEFVGALPAAQVRAFLDEHLPDATVAAARAAIARLGAGDLAGAEAALPPGAGGPPLVAATRARVALLRGRLDEARAAAATVPATSEEHEVAEAVLDAVALAEEGRAAAPEATADEAERHYLQAGRALAAGEPARALDELLEVVRRNRRLRDDGGRKRMLSLFQVLGVRSEMSDEYRRKLAILL